MSNGKRLEDWLGSDHIAEIKDVVSHGSESDKVLGRAQIYSIRTQSDTRTDVAAIKTAVEDLPEAIIKKFNGDRPKPTKFPEPKSSARKVRFGRLSIEGYDGNTVLRILLLCAVIACLAVGAFGLQILHKQRGELRELRTRLPAMVAVGGNSP